MTGAESAGAGTVPAVPPPARPPAPRPRRWRAHPGGRRDLAGAGHSGGEPTLLAFLTSGCSTCAGFWETLGEPRLPAGVRTVVVTHGAERERPARLRPLAPDGIPVVMSSQAWQDYAVPGAPYFVLVDGTIRGEGAATSWSALGSLVSDAIADAREAEAVPDGREAGAVPDGREAEAAAALEVLASGGTGRAQTVDRKLAAAGIGPDHPSLYPAGSGPASGE